jgi:hypothetical protein
MRGGDARPDVPIASDLLRWLETPPAGNDAGRQRQHQAALLVEKLGGNRAAVERLRDHYVHRLHRPGEDFAATEALRVVDAALALAPWPDGPWRWQHNLTSGSRRVRRRRRDAGRSEKVTLAPTRVTPLATDFGARGLQPEAVAR